MHLETGSVKIETPHQQKRIATIHRAGGLRDVKDSAWGSFDAHIFGMAQESGANWIMNKVVELRYDEDCIQVLPNNEEFVDYDLVVMATGKRTQALKMLKTLDIGYTPPVMAKAYISEIHLGNEEIFCDSDNGEVTLRTAGPNEFFGKMALVENDVRSASVPAIGEARIMHIDKRTFMRRVHEDPSLTYRAMESLAHEIRRLAAEVARLEGSGYD